MLVRCKECSQVVEVATLTEHLLVECEKHQDYTQCSQCSEAIRIDEIQNHSTECTGKLISSSTPGLQFSEIYCFRVD